jgi:hypothetical protein
MVYEITAVYRINAATPEDAIAIWLDDGPEVREGGGVLLHDASQLEPSQTGLGVVAEEMPSPSRNDAHKYLGCRSDA